MSPQVGSYTGRPLLENIKQTFAIRNQARKDKKPIENESKLENGVWLNVRETAANDGHMITVITDITESKKITDNLNKEIENLSKNLSQKEQNVLNFNNQVKELDLELNANNKYDQDLWDSFIDKAINESKFTKAY